MDNQESQKVNVGKDLFSNIATAQIQQPRPGLSQPEKTIFNQQSLPIFPQAKESSPRRRAPKIATEEQLKEALVAERQKYRSFLENKAPLLKSIREKIFIQSCQWREETDADRSDFLSVLAGKGEWQVVNIPHYGPPLGRATTLYRVELILPEAILKKERVVLCFKAVDYRCTPIINGIPLPQHEGFFEPFEVDITRFAKRHNTLVIRVENDFTMLGEAFAEGDVDGDKVYAATGFGYDDPILGWHHCPAGMGICQDVYVEGRSVCSVADIFVRPLEERGVIEVHVELDNLDSAPAPLYHLEVSIFGQNFKAEPLSHFIVHPTAVPEGGFGDLDKEMPASVPLRMGVGRNFLKFECPLQNPRLWNPDQPWLYQIQISLKDQHGHCHDTRQQQFGVRFFKQDENSVPKGKFYLNNREIRLRGANTMGNLDMCVFRKDFDQLIDDILLAKLTHLNFLRLTQRPVQKEVYEICDRLGMMLQTDLPLFGSMRHNQVIECVRQARAMEHLVRPFACNILVSFINEPFPASRGNPHRFVSRKDMETFFAMAIHAVHLENPARVIKCVDGDYDPPVKVGMPDNHCYCGWYLGHGVDLGALSAGHWMPVKTGWHFGCGEFGSEGLDSMQVMEQYYPEDWKALKADGTWDPSRLEKSQTQKFHLLWYSTPKTKNEWIEASQDHQAWITQQMTGSFRRMAGMNTFAIHLFIDAWPAGWMKSIMDVHRRPKKAWFTYRDHLTPLAVGLHSNRTTGFAGEDFEAEAWVLNDLDGAMNGYHLDYEVEYCGKVICRGQHLAEIRACAPQSQDFISFKLPQVTERTDLSVGLTLVNEKGQALHDTHFNIQVFPKSPNPEFGVYAVSPSMVRLVEDLGLHRVDSMDAASAVLLDDRPTNDSQCKKLAEAVTRGANIVFVELRPGQLDLGTVSLSVRKAGMGPRHFVSCDSGHPMVADFKANDFKLWYNEALHCASPLLTTVLEAPNWETILISGDGGWERPWGPVPVAVEKREGKGMWRVCQVTLTDRVKTNPAAREFAQRLLLYKG